MALTYRTEGVVYSSEDEKLKRYRGRVAAAERKLHGWLGLTETWLSYYRNKPKVWTKGGQKVRVPIAISSIDAMFSALTAVEVEMKLTPLGTTTVAQAEVAEEALRHEWTSTKAQQEVEFATKDALITGIGWVYVGYEFETAEEDRPLEEIEQEATQRIRDSVAQTGEFPDPDALAGDISATQERTLKDRVFVEHIPYDEVLWDPEAKKWPDVRWLCRKVVLPWEQVKNDPQFEHTEDLSWDTSLKSEWRSSKRDEPEDDEKRVTLYEMHDFEAGIVSWYPEEGDNILREDPDIFGNQLDYQDRSPHVPLILRTNPGEVHGIGDIEAMKPSIDEQNVLRSALATYVERMKPKIIAREGALTPAGKRAAKSQEWGEIVEVTQNTTAQDIRPFELPTLPAEAFSQDQKSAEDARNAIGLNELLQGILPVGKKTATGMAILQNASEIRQSERKNRMERFYTDIAQRILLAMQQYYDTPRITKIVGDTEEDIAWTWTGDDLVMLHKLEVSLQPKLAQDDQTIRENLMMLKNIFMPDQTVDQAELNRYIMKQMRIPREWQQRIQKSPEQQAQETQQGLKVQAAQAQAEEGIDPTEETAPDILGVGSTEGPPPFEEPSPA